MTDIRWLTQASSNPMGQQNYEQAIMTALTELDPADLHFTHATVGSVRSGADVRLPWNVVRRSSTSQRLAGHVLGRRGTLVHRFDLRLPPSDGPEVVTVHDFPPARFADEGRMPPWAWRSLRRTPVICPSEFAAQEIRSLFGAEDVTVIPYGVRTAFNTPQSMGETDLRALGIDRPFVLHAAGASVRKNLKSLAAAWRRIAPDYPDVLLVMAGPHHPVRTAIFEKLPRVVLTGPLPLMLVPSLMAAASLVVVPSTYEGFGLPALEAMAVGTPAVVARAGALPEVCREGALLVTPDGEGIASGLRRMLADEGCRDHYRSAGIERSRAFSWKRAAQQHADLYRRVLDGG